MTTHRTSVNLSAPSFLVSHQFHHCVLILKYYNMPVYPCTLATFCSLRPHRRQQGDASMGGEWGGVAPPKPSRRLGLVRCVEPVPQTRLTKEEPEGVKAGGA